MAWVEVIIDFSLFYILVDSHLLALLLGRPFLGASVSFLFLKLLEFAAHGPVHSLFKRLIVFLLIFALVLHSSFHPILQGASSLFFIFVLLGR